MQCLCGLEATSWLIPQGGFPAHTNIAPFGSKDFLAFLKQNNIRADLSLPRHPEANGVVERRNADIARLQRVLHGLGRNWSSFIEHSEWVLQTTRTAAHGHTPFEAFYGIPPHTAISRELDAPRPAFSSYYEREAYVFALRAAVDELHERALIKRRHDHDTNVVAHGILPGDYVKVWLPDVSSKLDPRLELAIAAEKADTHGNSFVVRPIDHSPAGTDALQALTRVVHVDRLKRIPALRDFTDDDKTAYHIRRVKDGLGTVESIISTIISRTGNFAHSVNVKWANLEVAAAAEAGLTSFPANKLKRNTVLQAYCAANNLNFETLTNNGAPTHVTMLPSSAAGAPAFIPAIIPAHTPQLTAPAADSTALAAIPPLTIPSLTPAAAMAAATLVSSSSRVRVNTQVSDLAPPLALPTSRTGRVRRAPR